MSDKKEINQEEINLALYKGDINPLLNLMRYFVYFDKGKPLSRTIALDIIYGKDENRGWFIIEDDIGMGKENNPIIYHYENGLWKKNGAAFIRNILLLEFLDKSNIRMQHEVLNSITSDSRLFINRNILNSCKNFINLKNGVYDYMIGSLLPHDMKYYFTTQFDIEYNKDAQCPKFLKFIGEVIKSDDINFMQEIFGYAFYSGYDIALLCFFIGGGRNGKTTTQQLLRALVGSKNATSVTMQQLVEDGFASARLYEKYLVLAGDTGKKSIYDASIIKRATGGDSINAADKYQKNFEFINFAKFIIGTNNPPIFGEKTLAMKERLKFIKFSNKFLSVI
jgi:putative DNA primase/helicase